MDNIADRDREHSSTDDADHERPVASQYNGKCQGDEEGRQFLIDKIPEIVAEFLLLSKHDDTNIFETVNERPQRQESNYKHHSRLIEICSGCGCQCDKDERYDGASQNAERPRGVQMIPSGIRVSYYRELEIGIAECLNESDGQRRHGHQAEIGGR